jgi:hypothetical protein
MSATQTARISEREAVTMSSDALVARTYEFVQGIDDDDIRDGLYRLLAEAFERWAPDAEWRAHLAYYREYEPKHHQRDEIEATREGLARRAALRIEAFCAEGIPGEEGGGS